jgi:hypothetical protein
VRGGSVDADANGKPAGGGTIIYSLIPVNQCSVISYQFEVKDKFGNELFTPGGEHADLSLPIAEDEEVIRLKKEIYAGEGELVFASGQALFGFVSKRLAGWSYNAFRWLVQQAVEVAHDDASRALIIEGLTMARDQMEAITAGNKKRSSLKMASTPFSTTSKNSAPARLTAIIIGLRERNINTSFRRRADQ